MSSKLHIGIVVYELTDACNQACKFCYNHWKSRDDSSLPDAPDFKLARKTLKELLRQAKVQTLTFSGGEPMLMPRIHDLVLQARFAGAQVNLLTNATCLKNDDIEIFHQLGVGRIQIPILGPNAAIHDAITQLPGSWEMAMKAARQVAHIHPSWLLPVLILNKLNIDHIESLMALYKEFGVKRVMVNRFNIGGLGIRHVQALHLSNEELREAFQRVDREAGRHGFRIHSGVCTPICVLDPHDYPHILFSHCNTDLNYRPLTLNYRGEVRFCNHSPRVLGNIYERPLSEILADPSILHYFDTIPTHCQACKLWKQCRGGCRAASEQLYGTFDLPDPILSIE